MMKLIFFSLFLIPLFFFNFWYISQFYTIIIFMIMIFYSCFDFFSNLSYFFGLDYYSYLLVSLTFFIFILMIFSSLMIYNSNSSSFFLLVCFFIYIFLVMFFFSLNMIYMYIFFEFTLIPLMFLILFWGYQPERLISSLYLFFYTLFGSLPLFFFILYLYISYNLIFFDNYMYFNYSFFSHLCLVFGFLIKFPMFMLHFWLPKAHVQAPVSGSMVLAGVLLKVGGYGLFRFMFINEGLFFSYSYIWFSFSILGSVFVSFLCFMQFDMKCLIAYSSVCHMGLCLLGILTMTKVGIFGSFMMMMSHGFCSSGLFFLSNLVYERVSSRSFFLSKGMIFFMPSMSLFWFFFCCFNMGCPPSLGFFSEVLIFVSCLYYWKFSFFFLFFISFLSACFSFFLYSYMQHGLFSSYYSFTFLFIREYLIIMIHLYPLVFLDFFLGSL